MLKILLLASFMAMSLLSACGGKSGNGGIIPTAPVVQDESEGAGAYAGSDIRVLSATDPQVQPVSQTDSTCADKDGAGHKIIDTRITPNTQFEKTIKAGVGGDKDAREFSITSTILTNDASSYSRQDNYKIPGATRSDKVTCDFKSVTGPWLNCLDQRSVKVTKATLHDTTNLNHCYVAWSHDEKDNKTTFQGLTLNISGKKINATKKVVEHDGLLSCDNKPVGPGKTIEVYIYSYDIPSLNKDSCSPGEIYFFYKKADNAGKIYENNSEALTSYLLPSENIYQDLPLPKEVPNFINLQTPSNVVP